MKASKMFGLRWCDQAGNVIPTEQNELSKSSKLKRQQNNG